MENEQLVGIVSDRDMLRGHSRDEERQPVSVADLQTQHHLVVEGVMSKQLEVLGLSGTLAEAAKAMVNHKIGSVPIVDKRKLVGIITEADLLRAIVTEIEQR